MNTVTQLSVLLRFDWQIPNHIDCVRVLSNTESSAACGLEENHAGFVQSKAYAILVEHTHTPFQESRVNADLP